MSKNDPCVKAVSLANNGDTDEALRKLQQCKKTVQKNIKKAKGNLVISRMLQKQLAKALRLEAQLLLSKNIVSKSVSSYDQALSILNKLPADEEVIYLKAHVNYSQALIFLVQNQTEQSISKYLLSRDLFASIKYHSECAEISLRLIEMSMQQRKFESAWEYSLELEKIVKKVKDKERKRILKPKLYQTQSKIKFSLNSKKDGLKFLSKAKKEYEKSKDHEGVISILIDQYRFDEGLTLGLKQDLLLEALEIANISESKKYLGIIETELGIFALKSGDFEKGKNRILKGLKIKTEIGDKLGTAQSLLELARITMLTAQAHDDIEKAKNFVTQSLELFNENDDQYGEAQALELLGTVLTKSQDLDSAISQLRASRKLFKKFKDRNSEARTMTQLGIALNQRNDNSEAITVLSKAKEIYRSTSNRQGLAEVLQLEGNIIEDKELAIISLRESRELYSQIIGNREELQPILFSLDMKIKELST